MSPARKRITAAKTASATITRRSKTLQLRFPPELNRSFRKLLTDRGFRWNSETGAWEMSESMTAWIEARYVAGRVARKL